VRAKQSREIDENALGNPLGIRRIRLEKRLSKSSLENEFIAKKKWVKENVS
jgi:hypothetical protein